MRLAGLRVAVGAALALAMSTAMALEASDLEPLLVAIELDGRAAGTRLVLVDTGGGILVEIADIALWRLGERAADRRHEGVDLVALDALDGVSYDLDRRTATLSIVRQPSVLDRTVIDHRRFDFGTPRRPGFGALLGYDATFSRFADREDFSTTLEGVAFGRWGHAEITYLGRDLSGSGDLTRLESRWDLDLPDRLRRLRVGDSISRATRWSRGVRFAGVQWTTAFDTRPDLITYPLPTLAGVATVPSTIDLFVDGALRLSQPVPAGPFEIRDPPLLNGRGDAQLVVRDLLGREQLVTVPFDTDHRLLRRGLVDVSYEAGFVRRGFGLESFDYGAAMIGAVHRRGVSDRLTAEAQAQVHEGGANLGTGALINVPRLGLVSLAGAVSESRDLGFGQRFDLGLRRTFRRFSTSFRTQLSSASFVDAATLGGGRTTTEQSSLRLAYTRRNTVVSVGYVRDDGAERALTELLVLSGSVRIGRRTAFTFSSVNELGGEGSLRFGVVRRIGRRTGQLEVSVRDDDVVARAEVRRSVPQGLGVGYRLSVEAGERRERLDAGVVWRTESAAVTADLSGVDDELGYRLSVSGSLVGLGRHVFASRRITDSFAVVEVPTHEDVGVYVNHHLSARTGRRGRALLPNLHAYHDHLISIDPDDLPIDVHISRFEEVAVPYRRTGLRVRFPVSTGRGARVFIVDEAGVPIPAGARVTRSTHSSVSFPVGFDGEVYLPDVGDAQHFTARWRDHSCMFEIVTELPVEALPRLGPYVCQAADR